MYFFTPYRKSTGEILFTSGFSCEDDNVEANYAHRLNSLDGAEHDFIRSPADPAIHYVTILGDERMVMEKPPMPYDIDKTVVVANGEDFITISGLHDPCEVVIDDPDPLVETVTTTVTGGSFEFSADMAGIYTIQIDEFPFLPMTLEIIAVNPEALETASYSSDFSYEFGP